MLGQHACDRVDDLLANCGGRKRDMKIVVHILRPFARTHADHTLLRAIDPAATVLDNECMSHVAPNLLALDQRAIEVKDYRVNIIPRSRHARRSFLRYGTMTIRRVLCAGAVHASAIDESAKVCVGTSIFRSAISCM